MHWKRKYDNYNCSAFYEPSYVIARAYQNGRFSFGGRDKMKKKIVPVGFFVLIVVLGALILFVTNKHSGTSAIPFVKVNDVIYVYDSTGYKVEELPETYSVIGEVIGNTASASKAQNGYASGLKVGEKIYQTSVKTDEVFVYTSLFSGDGTYRYVKFTSE